MKYLVFLFWIPALVVLYLSVHQEIKTESDPSPREKTQLTAHAGHPH
jgi:hypothetical protein